MQLILGIIGGLLTLTFLVVVHELGHALVARRNGVVVEEFGIGFPPRAWGKKLKKSILGKNVELSVNWLPLGGFVKLQGEHDAATKKGDYGAASFWVKTKILLAGVAVNWLTAVVLLTILAWFGLPEVLPNQFTVPSDTIRHSAPVTLTLVSSSSPAAAAGLKQGDEIVSFAGTPVASPDALMTDTAAHKGKQVTIVYRRGNSQHATTATLRESNTGGKGYLGVGTDQQGATLRATWSAPIVGVALTGQLTGATFAGLGQLVVNVWNGVTAQLSSSHTVRQQGSSDLQAASQSVSGPIGILGVLFPAAEQAGPGAFIFITALISLTLAVMNVLPIPALDGGRWFTMAVFRLLKKPLTEEREEKIQATGFMVLMALVVVVTVVDVAKIIK